MADYQYLSNNGVIVPDTAETLEAVRDEFRSAFGRDLDVSPETPQGVLITAETKARDAVIKNNASLANQINPNLAGGIFLDAIWALTGGKRVAAMPSVLRGVVLTGRPGTVVKAGIQVRAGTDGPIFELTGSLILNANGLAHGTFQALENGPIAVQESALDTIVTPVLGLETVTNPQSAEVGRAEESDQASRLRRRNTLALQGVALPEAIISGLYDKTRINGVKSLSFLENVTNEPMLVEGVTLRPHSVYACVDGGRDDEVAAMLLEKKSLGCGWNGQIKVEIQEPLSGQFYPVQFDRPERVTIWVKATIRNIKAVADPSRTARESMLAYANGEMNGEQGFVVGGDVSAFELAGAINRNTPALYVTNILVSQDGQNYSTEEIRIAVNQIAILQTGTIEVVVT
ncbi:baseplate J/gp47 family protein [Bartonella sp. LJL80]